MARRPIGDSRSQAEAAFKAATAKPIEAPAAPPPALPGVKEMVSLRIDRDVLDSFKPTARAGKIASTRRCARRRGSNVA
jgi:uncharacterized protein (DUF4415 family)